MYHATPVALRLKIGIIPAMLTLSVKERDTHASNEALREGGLVPAVLYGPKQPAVPIAIDAARLQQVWKEAGFTSVVSLTGAGEAKDALIHEVQTHPVSGGVLHADFYVLEKGKKVKIAVPLEFVGQAPAEKLGHIVVKALHEAEIEVAPSELPHKLEVDLSKLAGVGDRIVASDISLPGSATLVTHGEEIVASVTEFKEEKETAPAATAEAAVPAPEPTTPAASE